MSGVGVVPGAHQIELVRRVNLTGSAGPTLTNRVLAASLPGRGTRELALAGTKGDPDFGPRPVDPADLPADELIRVEPGWSRKI